MSRKAIQASRLAVQFLNRAGGILSSATVAAQPRMGSYYSSSAPPPAADNEWRQMTEADWRQKLTQEEYHVLREKGTERPWTGAFLDNVQRGVYTCGACGAPLFHSKTKFDSGSGWPSFYDKLKSEDGMENVVTKTDRTYGMVRTEVLCAQCDSHLGHVFPDGPRPTGQRYCINSVSLGFESDKKGEL